MKNWIKAALCLALCLCLCAPALAESVNVSLFTEIANDYYAFPRSMAAAGGKLYLLGGDTLYAFAPGEQAASPIASGLPTRAVTMGRKDEPEIDVILGGGDALYGLDTQEGMLFPLSLDGGAMGEAVTLDWSDYVFEGDGYTSYVDFACLVPMDGRLYALTRDYENGSGQPVLASFDMKTGEKTSYDTPNLQMICPYKDGKLLALVIDAENAWDDEKQAYVPAEFQTVDPLTGETETLGLYDGGSYYNVYGLTYVQETDTVYYITPSKAYRMVSFGAPELCAYFPAANLYARTSGSSIGMLIKENVYAIMGDTGVFVRTLDPASLPDKALTVYGEYGSDAFNHAVAKMGDLPVVALQDVWYATPQELGQALVSGETAMDVVCLNTDGTPSLKTMMEKGYCMDLSGDAELKAYVDSLYPFIRDAVMHDGKLYAIPVEMSAYGPAMYTEVSAKIGLTMPKTFLELCELITKWNDELYEEFPDCRPYQAESYRRAMLELGITLYSNHYMYTGEDMTFDTPLFRQMMAAVEAMHTDNLDANIDMDTATVEQMNELWSYDFLMEMYTGYDTQDSGMWTDSGEPYLVSAALRPADEEAPVTRVSLRVLTVNPKCAIPDVALSFLKSYVASVREDEKAKMAPLMNTPVENPDFELTMKSLNTALEQYREQLEKAETDAEKRDLEASVKRLETNVQDAERRYRYLSSEKSIAEFRALMEYAVVDQGEGIYGSNGGEISDLISRYYDGQLDLEAFIREADGKLRLMRFEQ